MFWHCSPTFQRCLTFCRGSSLQVTAGRWGTIHENLRHLSFPLYWICFEWTSALIRIWHLNKPNLINFDSLESETDDSWTVISHAGSPSVNSLWTCETNWKTWVMLRCESHQFHGQPQECLRWTIYNGLRIFLHEHDEELAIFSHEAQLRSQVIPKQRNCDIVMVPNSFRIHLSWSPRRNRKLNNIQLCLNALP